ncbi:hypothetical protein Cgig2_029649 [Carnegiea gigantea]|uniref:Aminotransferase-like plant mobile domain-containing protein n=1 Tax=Carnegiea gigantea TaxID=171969 RepID=A0A9Q1QJ55_9CARY|nr:hypothetical protein Cgig2_029649 [Carnegiea gigantea]
MAGSSSDETLIEKKADLIISPSSGKPSWRIAHFLKPSFSTSKQPQNLQIFLNPKKPTNPNAKSLTSKVDFCGWKRPLNEWNSWVEKLLPSFESSWKKTSIFEPIIASTFEIPKCNDTIFALAEKWCPETSSFLLPWGEVTITLEDVMVLGGYSVLGDSVLCSCNNEELCEIEKRLNEVRKVIMQTKAKKAGQDDWMDYWMGKVSKFEQEAFLSLWLSRHGLPCNSVGTIQKSVFPIAIHLARGTKIALAPAVLARIYRDLRLLKERNETLGVQGAGNLKKINLWAPLQLLQMWIWERFPKLSPVPNVVLDGQPRSARWNKVKILRKNDVGLVIDSAKERFKWRPYCASPNSCSVLAKFYPEDEKWVLVSSAIDSALQSYARLIRASYLVGLDCIEPYLPHRVSMQFGFDQDIPSGAFSQLKSNTSEIAWNNYSRPIKDVKLYIPSRLCVPGVTKRYLEWWKNSNFTEEDAKPSIANLSQCSLDGSERMRIKFENNEADVPPGFEPRGKRIRLQGKEGSYSTQVCSSHGVDAEDDSDDDNLTLSQLQLKRMNRADERTASSLSCSGAPLSPARDVCIREEKNSRLIEPVDLQNVIRVNNSSNSAVKVQNPVLRSTMPKKGTQETFP